MAFSGSLLRSLPNRQEILGGLRSPWVWVVLCVGLLADIWVWKHAEARERLLYAGRFERRIQDIRVDFLNQFRSRVLVLRGCEGLVTARDTLDRSTWNGYVRTLQLDRHQAGNLGVGYTVRIRPGDEAYWERRMRREGLEGFRIWPEEPGEERTAIVFLYPEHRRNQRAFGYDMFSEPNRRQAMSRARDSGGPALTERVHLVQEYPWDPQPQAGFLLYLPVYRPGLPRQTLEERREALEGYVYALFRMGDLMEDLLPNMEVAGMGFAIYEGKGVNPDSLLYQTDGYAEAVGTSGAPVIARTDTLPLYGRAWTVHYASGRGFLEESGVGRSLQFLALGAALSVLLAAGMLILLTTRVRAERLADQMTAELRALQENLERLVASRTRELEAANRELAAEMEQRAAQEEQLRQAQKMEAVGRLAGGVAHDFNNLLTAINGYAALSQEMAPRESPLRANLEEIQRAGDMAASLTRQLLAFSRKQILDMRLVPLNETVGQMGRMLRRIIGGDIRVDLQLSPEAGQVKVDPAQLQQALVNLCLNARDAMPRGGTLEIATGRAELSVAERGGLVGEAARAGEGVIPPGRYAVLTVRDTGHGMDEGVKARLFEPYFTTKRQGSDKGTGLGLSMVYGLVRQSEGYIQVFSEPGAGTTFRILLPEREAATAPAPADAT
jgi:signal transduction histidine kinase